MNRKYQNEYPSCDFCNGSGKISNFKHESMLGKIINGKIECPICGGWHDVLCTSDNGHKLECKLREHDE
jgi:hypothetical protein